jgi:GTPase SAR1 family protein
MVKASKPLAKVIIIGDGAVGKSSLLARFTQDSFSEVYNMTTAVHTEFADVEADGREIRLSLVVDI